LANEESVSTSGEHPADLFPLSREPSLLDTGERLGRYLIIERVGNGAMGVVYGAYDPELDRKIALKLLKGREVGQEDAARARLLREAKAMARLAHPNVIAVHDVGIFDGQVFLAMEFLGGGTLKSWLAAGPRHWREVLDVFVAAGRGLAAAHAAGLVHRDFKPENVLLDREGRPRVVDFGLAREAAASQHGSGDGSVAVTATEETSGNHLETLTRTGAIMGTPAYMAPEQIAGDATDERTDQFSFCVALYEALYGGRPFRGESLLRLLHRVTEGELEPTPEDREVPTWIRRALLRGLKADPAQRWPSMAPLIAALQDDPAARHRRRLLLGTASALLLAGVMVVAAMARHRHQEAEQAIGRHLNDAALAAQSGRAMADELRELRRRSFAAFDAVDRPRGEELWQRALALVPAADGAFQHAQQAYETVLVLDSSRAQARRALADLIYERVLLARDLHRDEQAGLLAALLDRHDDGGRAAELRRPATLMLRIAPVTASIAIERYRYDLPSGRRVALPVSDALASGAAATLPPGSYRLQARAPGYADTVDTFELEIGQRREVDLRLVPAAVVPTGFVPIPPGEFWFGDADEGLRTKFLDTVPIHRRRTGAFAIARHETSFREWIEFLGALSPVERGRHAPHLSGMVGGALRLSPSEGGWQIVLRPTSQRYTAREGEPIIYAGRNRLARQDWLDFPVTGVAPADVDRYLRWLRETGRVPHARLCTEVEWERAARGADDRAYPHGDELAPEDANFDLTYGRVDSAVGPDAVGAHPSSRSPFGVDDMAGNVLELVRSSVAPQGFVLRGGAYFFNAATCRLTNRTAVWSTFRDVTSGIRVCASIEETP
jgi:formylglycine-generating enzyme required for sulfatase activity/tRNA A-37 threonylcarbamoyl transferase component Bud32